jgi:hypothetical protein
MTDEKQLRSWREFHRHHAMLRLVSPVGNLSDAKMNLQANKVRGGA